MTSISDGGIAWTAGRCGFGGLRVSLTALVGTRPHSTARCITPWSIVIVLRIASMPDAGGLELRPEPRDRLRRQIAQAELAEPRQRVAVPQLRVHPQRRALEVRAGVHEPPLLDELGQRLGAGVEVGQGTAALHRPDLALERAGVGDPVERLAALAAVSSRQRTRQTAYVVPSRRLRSRFWIMGPPGTVPTPIGREGRKLTPSVQRRPQAIERTRAER